MRPTHPTPSTTNHAGSGSVLTRRVILTIAIVAVTISTLTTASLALFTDTEQISGNVFGTGTVDITSEPATAIMSAPQMVPDVPIVAPLEITNSGSLTLRYAAVSTTTENSFSSMLEMTVKVDVVDCSAAGFESSGDVVYGPGVLGRTDGANLFGSAAEGSDPGDRTLTPGAGEELCFSVVLPAELNDAAQGSSTVANFSFDAEQTLNNP